MTTIEVDTKNYGRIRSMQAVILAGGYGTRLSEETHLRPKPMVEIGGRPILWHIMKYYSHYGINDFIICCGYKGYIIKEYFANYHLHMSNVTIDLADGSYKTHENRAENWKVTLLDTGEDSMTGGRLRRCANYLNKGSPFFFTYGDGLTDLNLTKQLNFHNSKGTAATVCAVSPPGRYGALKIENDLVIDFQEKPSGQSGFINGGFFILEPSVLDLIENDQTSWEDEPLKKLHSAGELSAYKHTGFWQAMDTLRDKNILETLWRQEKAPWKIWP